MKIQDNMSTFQFSDNAKVTQEKQTIKESISNLANQAVKVSISKEGYNNYRSSISANQSFDDMATQKEMLKSSNLSTDPNYSFSFKISESLSDEDRKAAGYSTLSMNGRVTNIAETYTSLYDEIVQGYENGTRKVNVADGESETGYRTLTMEEELDALDEAYERAAETVEALAQQQPKVQKAFEEYRSKLEKIGTSRTELANAYEKQSQDSTENVVENIYEKMIAARDSWKSTYSVSGKSEAWQGMLSVINTMFSQKI